MNIATSTFVLIALTTSCATAVAADASGSGLVEVKAKHMDAAYVSVGADFRPYTKVMIDPAQVEFQKDWMTNVNSGEPGLSNQVTSRDAEKIAGVARSNLESIVADAFRAGGYEVVTAVGRDVLRLSPAIVDLDVNAPDTRPPAPTLSFTRETGEATLVLEARDSQTGTLLARMLDRRETRRKARLQLTSSVSNLSDFRVLFERWAGNSVKSLGDLKTQSPVRADLQPEQTL